MYRVTDLAKRDIINIADGSKLGMITDLNFKLVDGKVISNSCFTTEENEDLCSR